MTGLPPTAAAIDSGQLARQPVIGARSSDPEQVRRTAREFEAFFIGQMLEHMFKDVPTDGPFGGGHAEGMYRSMLLQHYGRAISDRGGIGIADVVSREMLKLQEAP